MTEEKGYQTGSLPSWGSLAAEDSETNPDLQWPFSIEVYDRMRREDSQVGSVIRAVTLPIRSVPWMIDPAGAREEVVDHIAKDLGLPVKGRPEPEVAPRRSKGRFSWGEHLRLVMLELIFGHSIFEQVYTIDDELQTHLKKLAWRPPRTISKFNVARDGGLISIEQHDTKEPIGVDHLVVYVNDREGGNWIGQSLFRTAYKNWLLKDRMLRAQALTVERNGLGVPVYTAAPIPDGASPDERETWQTSEKEAGLKIATGFRGGEAAGASLPHGATLALMGVTGKLPETDKPIRYHDEQIARAVLAHFLNLGTETGSWALGSTFANFFTDSLNAVAEHIKDITNQHVIEDIVDANWGTEEPAPKLVFDAVGSEAPATAEAIKLLLDSGALRWDPVLEAHMRAKYGLPVAEPTEEEAASSDEPPAPPANDSETDPAPLEEAA